MAAMSSSVPKSESVAPLKSSAASRRSAHHTEHSASSRRSHSRPDVQRCSRAAEESCWPDECEATSRRPLCHPRPISNRNGGDRRGITGQSHQAHAPLTHGCSQDEFIERQEVSWDERARSKPSRHPHHQHKPSRRDPPSPRYLHQGNPRPTRAPSPTPSPSKPADEAAFFFESKERTRSGSSLSLASDPPSSSSPLPATSRRSSASRGRSRRASSEFDSSLHPIVKSVFGQVKSPMRVKVCGQIQREASGG